MTVEAMREFDEILKNDAQYAYAYVGKGRVFLAGGKLEESKEQFIKALKLKPDLWEVYSFMGMICDRERDLRKLSKITTRLSPLTPDRQFFSIIWGCLTV